MASDSDAHCFDASLGCLFPSALEGLAAQLASIRIKADERDVVLGAAKECLFAVLHAKLARLLVLELNAARVTGTLTGKDKYERWNDFICRSSTAEYWQGLTTNYPTLASRVDAIVRNRCAAILEFARHFAATRDRLTTLLGAPARTLLSVDFGAGDTHQKGKTVAIVKCDGGKLVYKPRSLATDAVLRSFVVELGGAVDRQLSIGVPRVIDCGSFGWAEFVEHRYAGGDSELREFYLGIGHWLAVMRLIGGADLHAENLIAHGGSPVVVDCETLFTPQWPTTPSGLGAAFDTAARLVSGSVLGVGLLPGRGMGLGWRGVDNSALGMLPDQQPMVPLPAIIDAGTDDVRIGTKLVAAPKALNHPSPFPALAKYWAQVLEGFDDLTQALKRLDSADRLAPMLQEFGACQVRVVPRATEVYAEIARMLWHPVSLHNAEPAIERARGLLTKMADNVPSAPGEAQIIEAEINDLLHGDVPYFTARVDDGRFVGPAGLNWRTCGDLVATTLQAWREADFSMERGVIQSSLVSAYVNDGWMPDESSLLPREVRRQELDIRRRSVIERVVRQLESSAIRADDGSVAWIAPSLEPQGWMVQPLSPDLYSGISGVALVAAAHQREQAAGRVNAVAGLSELRSACLQSLDLANRYRERQRQGPYKVRPTPPGGYIGLGSQIWTLLTLAEWGMDDGMGVDLACRISGGISEAAAADQASDVLVGVAGAIVPLLWLHTVTRDEQYLKLACDMGDLLAGRAKRDNGTACWPSPQWPRGLGGFAHGATGIGWALSKLADAADGAKRDQFSALAQAGFAFERSLFLADEKNWADLRPDAGTTSVAAWCHGAVGIGLAQLDLDPNLDIDGSREIVRHAAAAARHRGMGWNHTACHGDLGVWELLRAAAAVGEAPEQCDDGQIIGLILTSIEDHQPISGFARKAFVPGLLAGLGGVAYQLMRAHPQSELPSVLTMQTVGP